MAWERTEWGCGHTGAMQLYGKQSERDATVAREAGRQCMACWLVEQWQAKNDPRSKREDRNPIAAAIAEGKGKRIAVPENIPAAVEANPLAALSIADLVAEIERRKEAANG